MDIFSLLLLSGGLAFFLYGMKVLSVRLEALAGGRLERSLQNMTKNRFVGLLLGTAITVAVQSSSAVTVMLIGLVNSGIMAFTSTLDVIFGANIGTTMTSWIFSLAGIEGNAFLLRLLKPEHLAPIAAIIGMFLRREKHGDKQRSLGEALLGFSILMTGMRVMTDAVKPLASSPVFSAILLRVENPFLLFALGIGITAILQSSSASVGILQALAATGDITGSFALPVVLGQNVGTCVTALLSVSGKDTAKAARRVAILHLSVNIIGAALWMMGYFLLQVFFPVPFLSAPAASISIAVLHTVFNLSTALCLMPFQRQLYWLAVRLVPDRPEQKEQDIQSPETILFPDIRLLATPSAAVSECIGSVAQMGALAFSNAEHALSMILSNLEDRVDTQPLDIAEKILENENQVDKCEDTISSYLSQLSQKITTMRDASQITKLFRVIGDFERLSDHAVNMIKLAKQKTECPFLVTDDEKQALLHCGHALREVLSMTQDAYAADNIALAEEIEPLEQVIDYIAEQVSAVYSSASNDHDETDFQAVQHSFWLSALLIHMERMSDHCSNIAAVVIEGQHGKFETHRYLRDLRTDNEIFSARYQYYLEKYAVV